MLQVMLHFLENPRAAEAGTTNHDAIHSILVETLLGALGGSHIPVTDNRDMDTRILLDVAYQCPVGFTGVHLGAGTAMNGQGFDATILQLLRQIDDDVEYAE